MSTEDRLRRAAHHEVDGIEPSPDGWARIEAGVTAADRRRRRQRAAVGALSLAAVVALVVGAVMVFADHDTHRVGTVPADTTSPSTTDRPVTTTPSDVPPSLIPADAVWPFEVSRFGDAVEAAERFMGEYVGMTDPAGVLVDDAGATATVQVRRRGRGGRAATIVTVLRHEGGAYVTAARTEQIRVDEPGSFQPVTSPVLVTGAASAFEGNVQVAVKEDGMAADDALGTGFVTGSGGEEPGPFSGSVEFRRPTRERGAVVFTISSAEDGAIEEATVVRVRFPLDDDRCVVPPPQSRSGEGRTVAVVFTCGRVAIDDPEFFVAVERQLPETQGVLRAALDQLLMGPTQQERDGGLTSSFSEETAGVLLGVDITGDGTAIVDLDDRLRELLSDVGTAAGTGVLLGQLNGTVFHLAEIQAIEYRLDGSCEAFSEWTQADCHVTERPD